MILLRAPTPYPVNFEAVPSGNKYTLNADGTVNVLEADVRGLMAVGFVYAIDTYGTWTPTLKGSTTAGVNTYSIQSGYYVKIGKLVFANFNIALSSLGGTIAGNVQIGGLPVAAGSLAGATPVAFTDEQNITLEATYTQLLGQIAAGASVAGLYEFKTSGASKALPVSQISSSSVLSGTLIYLTA